MKKIICFVMYMAFMISIFSGTAYAEEISNVNVTQNDLMQSTDEDNSNQISDAGGSNPENGEVNEDGVLVSKEVLPSEDENYFDIELNVTTTEELSQLENKQKIAMVFVLDKSNTMNTNVKDGNISRLDAAKQSAKTLLGTAIESEVGENGNIDIGFVAFDTDAKSIFNLTQLTDESITELENKIDRIQTESASSHKRFTNIEAGLTIADNMLAKSNALHKYVILLTDGFPTTYVKSTADKKSIDYIEGYDTYMESYTGVRSYDTDGYFVDPVHYNSSGENNREILKGTSYSDKAADRAQVKAGEIKNKGISIFTVGIDIGGQKIQIYVDSFKNSSYSVVDCYKTSVNGNYVIGKADDENSYKKWLAEKISGGNEDITYYFNGNNLKEMNAAYAKMLYDIKESVSKYVLGKWFVSDPMGENIEFKYFYDKAGNNAGNTLKGEDGENKENTAAFISDGNNISWDLRNSGFSKKIVDVADSKVTYYTYTLKYKVRLQNEKGNFAENKIYDTNGKTSLNYVVSKNGILSEEKIIEFPVPKVIGYLGDLIFNKISSDTGKGIGDVEFRLEHSHDCPVCNGKVNIESRNVFSSKEENTLGKVSFFNIPSGHKYILTEVLTPDGYMQNENNYIVSVDYGKTKLYDDGKEVFEISNIPTKSEIPSDKIPSISGGGNSESNSPKTGDNNILIPVFLSIISLFGLGIIVYKKKFMK